MIIQSLAHSTIDRLTDWQLGGNHIFIEATETFGGIVTGTDIMPSVESNNIIDSFIEFHSGNYNNIHKY